MISFLKGKVFQVNENTIFIDVNSVGYELFIAHPSKYKINEDVLFYTKHIIKEDNEFLIGFTNSKEKWIFDLLLKVKGIGPKTALSMLGSATPEEIESAIRNNDISFLKKLPCLGYRSASQIILDLKGDFRGFNDCKTYDDDVVDVLKSLGYKNKDINLILPKINNLKLNKQDAIKAALKMLSGINYETGR